MRRFINYYNNNKKRIKKFMVAFFIMTVAIMVKGGYHQVDTVVASATAITLDEPSYVPFVVRPTPVGDPPPSSTRRFPLKESHINIRAQSHNIKQASATVKAYLEDVQYECMPMRYFGVDYDIVVFHNVTLINPEVLHESDRYEFVQELGVDGKLRRVKRAEWIKVAHLDEDLNRQVVVLWGPQGYCFAHYEFENSEK